MLVISSGKERVAVPKVVDLTEDEARSTLEALGFKVTVKEQETDDSAKVGEVAGAGPGRVRQPREGLDGHASRSARSRRRSTFPT